MLPCDPTHIISARAEGINKPFIKSLQRPEQKPLRVSLRVPLRISSDIDHIDLLFPLLSCVIGFQDAVLVVARSIGFKDLRLREEETCYLLLPTW